MGRKPLQYTLRMESMFTPTQNPDLLSFNELRQANHALGFHACELRLHSRGVHHRWNTFQRSSSINGLMLKLNQLRLAPRKMVDWVSATVAASEKTANRSVESQRANESAEEDDEDKSCVGFEIFGAGVV